MKKKIFINCARCGILVQKRGKTKYCKPCGHDASTEQQRLQANKWDKERDQVGW